MKFTEGYWEKNERANASYAMQLFLHSARSQTEAVLWMSELSLQNLFLYVKIS